jgi:hypothetical protein
MELTGREVSIHDTVRLTGYENGGITLIFRVRRNTLCYSDLGTNRDISSGERFYHQHNDKGVENE